MLTILLIHLAGLSSPGPDFFYVVRQSAKHSNQAGILAALGISLGIIFWAGFAIFGLAWLNEQIGAVFQYLVMLIGGAYLAYIGFKMISVTQNIVFEHQAQETKALNAYVEIKKAFLINLLNAKAGIYFTSVVSAFIGNITSHFELWLLLFMFVITTFIYFALVALLFSRKPIQKFYATYSRYIDNAAGVIFCLFGLLLIKEGVFYFLA